MRSTKTVPKTETPIKNWDIAQLAAKERNPNLGNNFVHSLRTKSETRKAWSEWLHSLARWTLAATLTFKRFHIAETINQEILNETLRHVLRRIDYSCFGRSRVRRGEYVASFVLSDWGTYGSSPHAHLALAQPENIKYEHLAGFVKEAAAQTHWIDKQSAVVPYRSKGWSEYVVAHGPENLILPLLRPDKKFIESRSSNSTE